MHRDVLRIGQRGGIDRRCPNRRPNLAHGPAHDVKERLAGALHQMPAIGDLHGVRKRASRGEGIGTAAVAGNNGDLRLARHPRFSSRGLAIRQQGDRLAPLKVAD